MSKKSKNEADDLASTLTKCNIAYYNFGDSARTDAEYDEMKRSLRSLDPSHPFFSRVGAPAPKDSHLTKAIHTIHMGSVANAMNFAEFMRWLNKLPRADLLASFKADGLSVNLEYVDGVFKRAITRGDGITGEDVTANVARASNLPIFLLGGSKFTGNVRAEAILYRQDWRSADTDPAAKTPRNSAAGIVRRKSGVGANYLRVLAHGLYAAGLVGQSPLNHFTLLGSLGFNVVNYKLCASLDDARSFYEILVANRAMLDYEIDGVVFTVNDADLLRRLGVDGEQCYRGQIAWKFAAQTAITVLRSVDAQVGSMGAITPVAIFDPVIIGGVSVSRASLANFEQCDRLKIAVGDEIEVARSGDVIPLITRVVQNGSSGKERAKLLVKPPVTCPVCRGAVGNRTNVGGDQGVILSCLNPECSAKITGRIHRWVSSLAIKGLGDEVIEALCTTSFDELHEDHGGGDPQTRIVMDVADLYRLPQELPELKVNGRRLGDKAKTIMAEIDKTRKLTVTQFIGSLGVIHLGKRRTQLIREKIKGSDRNRLDNISGWFTRNGSLLVDNADMLGIPGIASEIQAGLDAIEPLVHRLLQYIEVTIPIAAKAANAKLAGKSFCFTGVRASPEELAKMRAAGGEEKSGVSAGLTYLVAKDADSSSSKAIKARQLGVKVISYTQFKTLL